MPKNGPSDQRFLITFSEKENGNYVQKVVFLGNFLHRMFGFNSSWGTLNSHDIQESVIDKGWIQRADSSQLLRLGYVFA